MNKMIVISFSTEEDAYEGLNALKELDAKGDTTLYATAVVKKDFDGKVTVKQADDQGPIGTAVGMLTGALVGALGGPVGMAVGSSAGGLTGAMFDMGEMGVNAGFVDEVSKVLLPGKTVVLAEVDEEWVTPIDTKMAQFDGIIFRRDKSEVFEDQLSAESEAFNKEVNELQTKLKNAKDSQKAKIEKRIAEIKADRKVRSEKLQEARKLTKEALLR